MIEELNVLGVYLPAALVWGVLAAVLVYLARGGLQRLPVYQLLWHPSLLELAFFIVLWWSLSALADSLLYRWTAS